MLNAQTQNIPTQKPFPPRECQPASCREVHVPCFLPRVEELVATRKLLSADSAVCQPLHSHLHNKASPMNCCLRKRSIFHHTPRSVRLGGKLLTAPAAGDVISLHPNSSMTTGSQSQGAEIFLHELCEHPWECGTSPQSFQDIPGSQGKQNCRGRERTFRPPPLHVQDPPPHLAVSAPKQVYSLCSFKTGQALRLASGEG